MALKQRKASHPDSATVLTENAAAHMRTLTLILTLALALTLTLTLRQLAAVWVALW